MATLSSNDIARAIYQNSKGKSGHDLSLSLKKSVEFLYRRNLLSRKDDIIEKLEIISNADNNIAVAKVWSAKKLGSDLRAELVSFLKKYYKANEVELQEFIDDKLLGGVRIEINNEVIDLTLKNKIAQLQKHLTGNAK